MKIQSILVLGVLIGYSAALAETNNSLSSGKAIQISKLDMNLVIQGYGRPAVDKSFADTPLRINGRAFTSGIAVNAESLLAIALDGKALRFRAVCGVDDDSVDTAASVKFHVLADGKTVWSSELMKPGISGATVDIPLKNVRVLVLKVDDGGDGIRSDHADWADAIIDYSGEAPVAMLPPSAMKVSKPSKQIGAKRFIPLSSLDLRLLGQGYGQPGLNRAMEGGPMQITGIRFEHGVAVHAESNFTIALDGKAVNFHAICGVDDDSLSGPASVKFHVFGDGKLLWSSELMKPGIPAVRADVPLKGVRSLVLKVDDGGDGIRSDHGDWAEAAIDYDGETPVATFNGPLEKPLKKMVAFTLELYYMKDSDKKFAEEEAKRMVALLGKIAPHIELDIKVVKATAPFRSKFESGGWHDVPNHQPSNKNFQSLLITEEDIGAAGWAGPVMGCLSKQRLQDKLARGGDSADISLHEWMHTLYGQKINGREIGWLHANPQFGFSDPDYLDTCGDGIWHKWYTFLLRWK